MTKVKQPRVASFDMLNPFDGAFWVRPMHEIESDLSGIRAHGPVFLPEPAPADSQTPPGPGAWLFTSHEDIMSISRAPELFSSAQGIDLGGVFKDANGEVLFGNIITLDDPRHVRQRRLVSRGFTPRMLARLNDSIQLIATSIVDDIIDRGEVDFVVDVAARLPLRIVCDLMGIPESQHDLVFQCTNVILGGSDPEYRAENEDIYSATIAAAGQLVQVMTEVADAKRGEGGTDLTSILIEASDEFSSDELAGFFLLLVVAGNETTRNAIAWGLKLLTENPDQLAIWQADFEGIAPLAVEEIVRVASPIIYMRRTATCDTTVSNTLVRAGEKVCMMYLAANRDEKVFDNPHAFDILRSPNRHLGYGGPGPHFCLGAHLARREITVMFRELFRRIPDIRASAEPELLHSSFVHGIKHLRASFTPLG